jgi:glycosyltransferase involved in cell wall biosynthesis
MIRVGLVVHGGGVWLGGVYYVRTISRVLESLGGRYRPVWLVPRDKAEFAREVERTEGVETAPFVPDNGSLPYPIAGALGIAGHRTIPLERDARRARIDCVLPIIRALGRRSWVRWVGWLWDFQHVHHPEFFTKHEVAQRDRAMRRLAAEASHVIVSSHHALGVALERFPWLEHDITAMRFPSLPEDAWYAREPAETVRRYGLEERFFYFPAQLWVHKNHETAFKAWARLGRDAPMLVCSGDMSDYRHPGLLERLRQTLASDGVEDRVRILGRIPREDQIDLYRASLAVINPSLYEGWSTTVEEARTLGKTLVLSDIDLFKEQGPPGTHFFPKRSDEALAELVRELARSGKPGPDKAAEEAAKQQLLPHVESYRKALVHSIERAMGERAAPVRFVL